jgi:hypothetical protein
MLTDTAIRKAKPGEKPAKLSDEKGLYLPERRKLMQWWGDYLDGAKAGAEVVPFKRMA